MKTNELLKKFQDLYEQEQFEKAQAFLKENKEQFGGGVYFYNQGIISLRLGNKSEARLNLEKSKKIAGESTKLNDALDRVKIELSVVRAEKPQSIADHLYKVTDFIGPSIIIISCLLLGIIFAYNLKKVKGIINKTVILVLITLPAIYTNHYFNTQKYIVTEEIGVRPGPSKIFEEAFVLPKGLKVGITKKFQTWSYISYPSRYAGWIKISNKDQI